MERSFTKFLSYNWVSPAILLLLTALVYGPFIPLLGYYWDDWPVINLIQNHADFWSFYAYDRPFSAWTFVLTAPLFGVSPLKWHLFTLMMRWLTTLGVWWTLKQLWPHFPSRVTWIAILFAVYPAFTLQPIAVAFSQHWIMWAFCAFSLGAMLAAQRMPQHFRIFTFLALVTQVIHALTMEYLWGLELIRPVLLWMVIRPDSPRKKRLIHTIKHSLPYYGVLAGLVIWRAFFLEIPGGDPNALKLLDLIRENPLSGFQYGLTIALRDLIQLIFSTWTDALSPELLDISDRFLVAAWGWVFLLGGVTFIFLWLHAKKEITETEQKPFYHQAIPLGILAMVVSLLPTWATDNKITVGLFASRYALPALFGVSIFLIGCIDYFFRETHQKVMVLAICVGLSAGVHLRNANDFRWDWVKQQRFFWQLAWRVPGLEDRTALFSDGAVFRYVGSYSTSSALNTLYPLQVPYPEQSYWFVELDRTFLRDMEAFVSGATVNSHLRNLTFSSTSHDGIVIFYEPDVSNCFWVLSPGDELNGDLPALTAQGVPASNLDRIQLEQTYSEETVRAILGPEPEHTWCYYYQKAGLAQQTEDWQEIARLGEEATRLGYEPTNPFEWFPFIEAHARLGNWETAEEQILGAFKFAKKTRDRPAFCAFWQSIAPDDTMTSVSDELGCEQLTD